MSLNPSTPVSISTSYTIEKTAIPNRQYYLPSSAIHSSKGRQSVYPKTPLGKLRNSTLRTGLFSPTNDSGAEKISQSLATENWRRTITVEMDEQSLEKGLRDYLGIAPPSRTKTLGISESDSYSSMRVRRSTKRLAFNTPANENIFKKEFLNFGQPVRLRDFSNEPVGEKYQHVTFMKAPSKEFLNILKLTSYDVTLVPSDSRRAIIEAIMRDYFLSLIPENSEFIITKNSQTNIFTIVFTGKLVPICKACSALGRLELSKDLGFQVICTSTYCSVKILHRSKLSDKTCIFLWPVGAKPDVERSLFLNEEKKKPVISKMIQSGRYKRADLFSQVLLDTSPNSKKGFTLRPSTSTNLVTTPTSTQSRIIIRTFPSKSPKAEHHRSNTIEGLIRSVKLRSSQSSSPGPKNFRGASILKDLDDDGFFVKEPNEWKVTEEETEETGRMEEREQVVRNRLRIQEEKSKGITKFSLLGKKNVGLQLREKVVSHPTKIQMAYPVKLDRKTLFKDESSDSFDNSDIHEMVNILSKEPKDAVH